MLSLSNFTESTEYRDSVTSQERSSRQEKRVLKWKKTLKVEELKERFEKIFNNLTQQK